MYKLKTINLNSILGIGSLLSLLALAYFIISPPIANSASAEESTIDSTAIGVNINAASVVSIALSDRASMEIVPKASGTFNSKSATVTVSTNNTSGYKIFMNTLDGTPNLKNVNTTTDKVIASVATNVTSQTMPINTWGYNLSAGSVVPSDTMTFSKIPAVSTQIEKIDSTTGAGDTFTLSFGAKIDTTLPAGQYSNQVVLSAVANPIDINNLQSLTYMQDMTNSICANTKGTDGQEVTADLHNEPSKQLIDIRDGNTYWVSKLADGNCWMTQNLNLDITQTMINAGSLNNTNTDLGYTGTGELATEDGIVWGSNISNLTSTDGKDTCADNSWIDPSKNSDNVSRNCALSEDGKAHYIPMATKEISEEHPLSGTADATIGTTMSWNFGKYLRSRPLWNGVKCSNVHWLDECAVAYGIYDVSDTTKWSATYNSAADPININKTGLDYKAIKCTENEEVFDSTSGKFTSTCTGGEYDPHYLLGNYYQINTVTAGSSGTITNTNATNSICPKGWKLPIGGEYSDTGLPNTEIVDSYARLFSLYNFIYDKKGSYGNWHLGASNPNTDGLNVANRPFYITFGGEINANNVLTDFGGTHILTSTMDNTPGKFIYPLINISGAWPTAYWNGYIGMPVRCLAR